MSKKVFATIAIVLIYAGLIGLTAYVFLGVWQCESETCIRFCSADVDRYTNKFLLDKFRKSKTGVESYIFYGIEHENDLKNIHVARGMPTCGDLKFVPPNENSSDAPYDLYGSGRFRIEGMKYKYNRYCLELSEDVYDNWKLMICHQDYKIQKIFQVILIFASILLLGFVIFVYSYFSELRDFHGKCVISFLAAQIFAYALLPVILYTKDKDDRGEKRFLFMFLLIISFGFVLILMWLTAMIVNIFTTFRNFKDQKVTSDNFSTYALFIINFAVFSAFMFAWEYTSFYNTGIQYLFFIYSITAVLDIILLIWTGIDILRTSRNLQHADHARFDKERKWYWIYVKLVLIMIVTWPYEIIMWEAEFNIFGHLTADLVSLFTAFVISIILLGRKETKILLLSKYRGITDVEAE